MRGFDAGHGESQAGGDDDCRYRPSAEYLEACR